MTADMLSLVPVFLIAAITETNADKSLVNNSQWYTYPRGFQIGEVGLMFADESYPG